MTYQSLSEHNERKFAVKFAVIAQARNQNIQIYKYTKLEFSSPISADVGVWARTLEWSPRKSRNELEERKSQGLIEEAVLMDDERYLLTPLYRFMKGVSLNRNVKAHSSICNTSYK